MLQKETKTHTRTHARIRTFSLLQAKFCSFPDRAENTRRIAELSMRAKQEESMSLIKDMQQ